MQEGAGVRRVKVRACCALCCTTETLIYIALGPPIAPTEPCRTCQRQRQRAHLNAVLEVVVLSSAAAQQDEALGTLHGCLVPREDCMRLQVGGKDPSNV